MEYLALGLALLALLLAWSAHTRSKGLARGLDEAALAARRGSSNAASDLQGMLETQRRLLARLAGGERLSPEMVLEGRLWRDVGEAEARELLTRESALCLLDVRTPAETQHGILPGARLIPLDQLEARHRELPRSGMILVYCAAGARSAAACEFLSGAGYERLLNLEGGYSTWNGPRTQPPTG